MYYIYASIGEDESQKKEFVITMDKLCMQLRDLIQVNWQRKHWWNWVLERVYWYEIMFFLRYWKKSCGKMVSNQAPRYGIKLQ